MADDELTCCEEWCERGGRDGGHDDTCPDATMKITKGDLVALINNAAAAAIDDYVLGLAEEESPADAKEGALDSAEEQSICYVGIGSCGRGWCDHS